MIDTGTPEEAMSVAVALAREHGITVESPVLLRSTNNVVAWLRPAPIVAKIGNGRTARLDVELKVARELGLLDAPVVLPAPQLPAVVHARHEREVTFWCYHAQDGCAEIPPAQIAPALKRLHAALAGLSPALIADLPRYTQELRAVARMLRGSDRLPALSVPDQRLLANTFDRLEAELDALAHPEAFQVLHGSPHPYNVLRIGGEPVFIDLESACIGPVEWDLAHLDPQAQAGYGAAIDTRLFWVCRGMVSVKTATWCWASLERGDLREHAEWHLSHIKTRVAPFVQRAKARPPSDPS